MNTTTVDVLILKARKLHRLLKEDGESKDLPPALVEQRKADLKRQIREIAEDLEAGGAMTRELEKELELER
jgi:hypothetical protein